MGVMEDVILNAKSAVAAVGKKAASIVDISKLRLSAAEINNELANQFEVIGRTVYDAKKTGENADEAIQKCLEGIDELFEQLDAVNEKIEEQKKSLKCPQCGTHNVKSACYCSKCGAKLEQ